MRVENPGDHGVFVQHHGVIPAGETATVRDIPAVKQMIKDGTLREARASGGGSSDDRKEGDS